MQISFYLFCLYLLGIVLTMLWALYQVVMIIIEGIKGR